MRFGMGNESGLSLASMGVRQIAHDSPGGLRFLGQSYTEEGNCVEQTATAERAKNRRVNALARTSRSRIALWTFKRQGRGHL